MTDDITPTTAPDPRYMAAVAAQQAAKAKLTLRRAPILRLVWNRDAALPDINVLLEAFKS